MLDVSNLYEGLWTDYRDSMSRGMLYAMFTSKTSLYTALTVAIMSTFLLMSFAVLQYLPFSGPGEALLVRAPKLSTDVWGVFNTITGEVRYGSNVEEVRPIASITKLFTAYAVIRTESEDLTTTLTWADINTDGRAGKLTQGTKLTMRDLLFPLLVVSSNDAGSAIGRTLGTKLQDTTDALILERSLAHTTINDPTGLGSDNTSTVSDLAKFFVHVRTTYPYLTDITQLRMHVSSFGGLLNNNPIRALDTFRGGKHGFTPEAGRTFVGTVILPNGGEEIGIVLLGSSNLVGDVQEIVDSFN